MRFLKLAFLLPFFVVFSCSSDDGLKYIEFETIAKSDQSPINPGRSQHVLNTEAEYEALFGTAAPAGIDFLSETVIAVFLGSVGSSGNSFEVTEIIDNVQSITVKITWKSPRVREAETPITTM